VHHLRPRIPNYNLQRCLDATPQFQVPRPLTLWRSVGCARLALWDERENVLVSFRAVARRRLCEDRPRPWPPDGAQPLSASLSTPSP
jgi:omega-6 fatty acid desaturase (delta-12 desaturase)